MNSSHFAIPRSADERKRLIKWFLKVIVGAAVSVVIAQLITYATNTGVDPVTTSSTAAATGATVVGWNEIWPYLAGLLLFLIFGTIMLTIACLLLLIVLI